MDGNVRACTRRRRIDADAGNEVIQCAGGGINWNPGDLAPVGAVGRRAIDQIVRRASRTKAAIFPRGRVLIAS